MQVTIFTLLILEIFVRKDGTQPADIHFLAIFQKTRVTFCPKETKVEQLNKVPVR
jgi:hypothetical protein